MVYFSGNHCENGGNNATNTGAQSQQSSEYGEYGESEGNHKEREHEPGSIIKEVFVDHEIGWNIARWEIVGGREGESSMMMATVHIFTVSGSATDSPECPLSVTYIKSDSAGLEPDGDCTPLLNEEISTEMKKVSLRGTESCTPARMTKSNKSTAPSI